MAGADRLRRSVGVVGEILVTLGVLLAGFVFYQVVWTDLRSGDKQRDAAASLEQSWAEGHPNLRRGPGADDSPVAFARLWIPEFGSDFRYAVMDDVRDIDLESGPGHYPGTQLPGEPGNFAVAGHRVGRGSPFNDIDLLKTCSPVVIETADRWYEYRVLPLDPDQRAAADCLPEEIAARVDTDYAGVPGRSIVLPSQVSVLDPVPGSSAPAGPQDLPLLTLTTCHPQFSAAERLIIHAVLVDSTEKRSGELPPVLAGDR